MHTNPELEQWMAVVLPATMSAAWTPSAARAGLAELRRLRHGLDAAQAHLVGVLSQETGRDTRATMRRDYGMSSAEATRASMVAEVVRKLDGAGAALTSGRASAEHLRHLHPVIGSEGAGKLLRDLLASGESADDFAKRVERWRIEQEGPSRRARQRAARGVWFSNTEHGGISMRAVVGKVDGERMRAVLNDITDRMWKAAHPERAATVGAHGDEPRERRLADALVELFEGAVVESDVVDRVAAGGESDDGESDDGVGDVVGVDDVGGGAESDRETARDGAPAAGASASPVPARPSAPVPAARLGGFGRGPLARGGFARGGAGRTAVVVTVDALTLDAALLGAGPISNDELLDVLAGARVDLYAAVRDARGAILKFGRSRRLASPLQRLALAVRDGGCIWSGCAARWDRCDADHDPPWEQGGRTDLDQLRLLCTNEHHPHRHETDTNAAFVGGEWKVLAGVGAEAPP